MVLNLFFVVLYLLFNSVGCKSECMAYIVIPVDGDKFVFVFSVSQNLDRNFTIALAVKIHRYNDGGKPIEEVEQLLGLVLEFFLDIAGKMPVSG